MEMIPYGSQFKIQAEFMAPDGTSGIISFPLSQNLKVSSTIGPWGSKNIDVSFSASDFTISTFEKEILKGTKPIEPLKDKKEKEMKTGNFITAIFPNALGEYEPDAKAYYYEVKGTIPLLPKRGDRIIVTKNCRVTKELMEDSFKYGPIKEEPYGKTVLKVVRVLKDVKYSCMPAEMENIAALASWSMICEYIPEIISDKKKESQFPNKERPQFEDYFSLCDMDINPETVTISTPSDSIYIDTSKIAGSDIIYNISDHPAALNISDINNFKIYKLEDKNMNMRKLMGDFMFGRFDNTTVKYSFNGIAFQSADGTYNVYNEDGTLTNVSDMVIDIPVFAIPVAKADLKVGDVILHPTDRTPLVVKENAQTAIIAVEPKSNEVKTFAPKKSIFGFDFYTKITTPMDMFGGANADEGNPFGNMLPFLMFSDGEFDMNTMLMFTMMNGANGGTIDMNTMLPFLMLGNKSGDSNDFLMAMLMAKGFNTNCDKK